MIINHKGNTISKKPKRKQTYFKATNGYDLWRKNNQRVESFSASLLDIFATCTRKKEIIRTDPFVMRGYLCISIIP